jgi:transposase
MVRINLSTDEVVLLQRYRKTSPIALLRDKAQAMLLRSRGVAIKDIAFSLNVGYRTVERWIKDFSERRMASIFSGLVGNENAAKLTKEQKTAIAKALREKPSRYGLLKEFWDVPQLKRYVYARFGTVYESERSYHFLLEFGNLSFKYPDIFNVKRNEKQIADRMEEIYGEILPYMEDPNWEIFCSDEVRMQLEAITRRAWLKKGEKTVLRVERSNDYQNYLGFLNQKTFICHVFEIAWGRAEEIIRAIGAFIKLYPNKNICIIWDNAKCHKGKLVREAVAKGGLLKRVHLIALPPYAPDHNPIEHVWNTTKDGLSNDQSENFAVTKQKFMQRVNGKFFYYQI